MVSIGAHLLNGPPARATSRSPLVIMAIMITALLTGCGRMTDFQERVDYWSMEQSLFFRGLVTIDDIHPWLRERGVIYTFDPQDIVDRTWTVTLEKVYPQSLRCEWINIDLVVGFDDIGRVQSTYIDFNEACWW